MAQYYKDKTAKLFAATGHTVYYAHCHLSFEMECQRNPTLDYGVKWYGLRLSGGKITKPVAAAISKLVGIDKPGEAIAAFKAIPAEYCSAAGEYVPCSASIELAEK